MFYFDARPYADDMTTHISHVEAFLRAVRNGRQPSPIAALWNIRILQDKLRHAQRPELARVCLDLEQQLVGLGGNSESQDLAHALLEVTSNVKSGLTSKTWNLGVEFSCAMNLGDAAPARI